MWEVLGCISFWREFISLFLCCKDLEFPQTPLTMALFQAAFYLLFYLLLLPAGLTFCQVGRREQQPGSGQYLPCLGCPDLEPGSVKKTTPVSATNSSPLCQAFYTCSNFLFCYFNLPIHIIAIYFLFRKFRKKSDLLIVSLLFSRLP